LTKRQVANCLGVNVSKVASDSSIVNNNRIGLKNNNCKVFSIKDILSNVFMGSSTGSLSSSFRYYMERNLVPDGPLYRKYIKRINEKPRQQREVCLAKNKSEQKVWIIDGKHMIHASISNHINFDIIFSAKFYDVDMKPNQFDQLKKDLREQYSNRFPNTVCHDLLKLPHIVSAVDRARAKFSSLLQPITLEPDKHASCSNSGRSFSISQFSFVLSEWFENRNFPMGADFNINRNRTKGIVLSSKFANFINGRPCNLDHFIETFIDVSEIVRSYFYGLPNNLKDIWFQALTGIVVGLCRCDVKSRRAFVRLMETKAISLNLEVALDLVGRFRGNSMPYTIWARAARDTFLSIAHPSVHGVVYDDSGNLVGPGNKIPDRFLFRYTSTSKVFKGLIASSPSNTFSSAQLEYRPGGYPLYV